jgi:hypothetical protein
MTAERNVEVEAAAMIRRILDAVERGELAPGGVEGTAMVRRLEGAVVALEAKDTDGAGEVNAEAAALLRRMVASASVDEGGRPAALLRRMEGAAVALEADAAR